MHAACAVLLWAAAAGAQPPAAVRAGADLPSTEAAQMASEWSALLAARGVTEQDAPLPPVAPEVIRRDESGHATIRAVRIERPLQIDGHLDEEIFERLSPAEGFIQQVPREGQAATERTSLWVLFDDRNLYLAFKCYESQPERHIATELRRDNNNITQGDNVTVVLDTFLDRRNGFFFQTNSIGAFRDQSISNTTQNPDWNTVWNTKSAYFEGGWTSEISIPFRSLRYRGSGRQVWGINIRRIVKWKNEIDTLTPLLAAYGQPGISQMAAAATLVGLEAPPNALNVEMKPYSVTSVTTDNTAATPTSNAGKLTGGVDVKYGLTSSLIADATINTDFAQVEEDVQQVNLTRFSLFFPEKRDFFLEGQGIFTFGDTRIRNSDVPIVFFSRRIGLNQGQPVPVIAGARVTGKAGRFDVGALNIQTGEKLQAGAESTNFTALRLKRDVFQRSSIGLIATQRLPGGSDGSSSVAFGADANFRLTNNVTVLGYVARNARAAGDGYAPSYRGLFDYVADRYGFSAEHLMVSSGFDPQVGFVRRQDFRRSTMLARFSPRLRRSRVIRQLRWQGSLDYITNTAASRVENRTWNGSFDIDFHNSDQFTVSYANDYELLPGDFTISPGVVVPRGGYKYQIARAEYTLGQQRPLSGTFTVGRGTFYNGDRTEAKYTGRLAFPRFSLEPSFSLNWVKLPYGDFTARLVTSRFIFTPSARTMITGLLQVNPTTQTISSSVRLRWEYLIGSQLFVVYTDGRNTAGPGLSLLNHSLSVKFTRLVRF
ncbi:MAG: DUF5916 domain-containing protein [Vicinamibacterales bacterium]